MKRIATSWLGLVLVSAACAQLQPAGSVKGSAFVHTPVSAAAVVEGGSLALPAAATGGTAYLGPWRSAPSEVRARVPVVVFLHGSSGLGLKAIGQWQAWLAERGIASFAPDSFALPDRVTYSSPAPVEVYERIHALRASEIALAVDALKRAPWADPGRWVLAGTSEGAVAVMRYGGKEFLGRIVFSWSCENNYFVRDHGSVVPEGQPVLNVMSLADPYFSPANAWLGNQAALGHCGNVLKASPVSSVLLIPGAPHTLINLPQVRRATEGFLGALWKRP